ncbi:Triosephosphate isomerase, partial [hydrothermal vent metagenome]
CKYVIVGHSERRQYFGETDETVNRKIKISLKFGLKTIVCVGESLDERETGKTLEILTSQVVWALKGLEKGDLDHVVIAYEPVWAIGTGKTATPAQADGAHAHIRKEIKELYDENVADDIRILYGGSMKPGNAAELLNLENIDGGLIGGASLKAGDFVAIIDAGVKASE